MSDLHLSLSLDDSKGKSHSISTSESTSQSTNQSANLSSNQSNDAPVNQSVNQSINLSNDLAARLKSKRRHTMPGASAELTRIRLIHLDLIEMNDHGMIVCLPCKAAGALSQWKATAIEKSGTGPIVMHTVKNHFDESLNLLAELHSRPDLLSFRSNYQPARNGGVDLSGTANADTDTASSSTDQPFKNEFTAGSATDLNSKIVTSVSKSTKKKSLKRPVAQISTDYSMDDYDTNIYPTEPPVMKPTLPAIYRPHTFDDFEYQAPSLRDQPTRRPSSPPIKQQYVKPGRSAEDVFASAVQFISCVGLDWRAMKHESFNQLIDHSIPSSFEISHDSFVNQLSIQSEQAKQTMVENFAKTKITITLSIDFEEKQPNQTSRWLGSTDSTNPSSSSPPPVEQNIKTRKSSKRASKASDPSPTTSQSSDQQVPDSNQLPDQSITAHIMMHAAGRTWLWSSVTVHNASLDPPIDASTNPAVAQFVTGLSTEFEALKAICIESGPNKHTLVKQSLGLGVLVIPSQSVNPAIHQICTSLSTQHDLITVPSAGHSIHRMIDALLKHDTVATILEPFQSTIRCLQTTLQHTPKTATTWSSDSSSDSSTSPSEVPSSVSDLLKRLSGMSIHHLIKELMPLKSDFMNCQLVNPSLSKCITRLTERSWVELSDLADVLQFFDETIAQLENTSSRPLSTSDTPVLHKNTIYATILAYHRIVTKATEWDSLQPFRAQSLRQVEWTKIVMPILHELAGANVSTDNIVVPTIAWLSLSLRPKWLTYDRSRTIQFIVRYGPLLALTQYRHQSTIIHSIRNGDYARGLEQQANEFDALSGPFACTPLERQSFSTGRLDGVDYWWARTTNRQTQLLAHFALSMFGIAALSSDVQQHQIVKIDDLYRVKHLSDVQLTQYRQMQISHPASQQYIDKYGQ